jgi:hypothetical protein
MVAIHRILAVPQSAQSAGPGLQRLPTPVLRRPSEGDDAQQRALGNEERHGIVGGFRAALRLSAEPHFAVDRTVRPQDLNSLRLGQASEVDIHKSGKNFFVKTATPVL